MVDLVVDLTGGGMIDDLPAAKRLLVESAMQTLIVSRALFAMFIESRDPELASRHATQATTLHRALCTLGLERHEREINLESYLATKARENRSDNANPNRSDLASADVMVDASRGEGGAPDSCPSTPLGASPSFSHHEKMGVAEPDGKQDQTNEPTPQPTGEPT